MKLLTFALAISTTLVLSACSSEGTGFEAQNQAQLGAANALSGTVQVTPVDSIDSSTAGSVGVDASSQTSTDVQFPSSGQSSNVTDNSSAMANNPVISFKGTSVQPDPISGDTLFLDGSHSSVKDSELISYQWTQVDDGKPRVSLNDAATSVASFIARPDIDGAQLTFQLTVEASNGKTATSKFSYVWAITPLPGDVPAEPEPTTEPTTEPVNPQYGTFTFDQTGSYFAQSVNSVYVADQTLNRIIHVDMGNGVVLQSWSLPDQPTKVVHLESTNIIYIALRATDKLVKIRLSTGGYSEIAIAAPALALDAHDGRVYYTTENSPDFDLYSVGLDDANQLHGVIEGDLIEHNPVLNEIVAARSGRSPGTVYRYSITADGTAVEEQSSSDLGSNARDISISADGLRMAVAQGSGNGSDYTIHDLMPTDLTVSNGAWDTGPYPISSDFSASGDFFAASNTQDIGVFSTATYLRLNTFGIDVTLCGLDYYSVNDVQFTNDDQHVLARLVCGFNQERSVLFYFTVD